MASRRKKRPLRPRTPSRVKKRTKRERRVRGHQHPELIGLGLAALGLFLASLLLVGWEGGIVGEEIEAALRDVVGSAAYAVPIALTVVGSLMLFRSALVEVRPFRTGLVLTIAGLLITLGSDHGGAVGGLLGGGLAKLLGTTGSLIVGVTALVAGALLLTGASAGAILRRSGGAVRRASSAARRRVERPDDRGACVPGTQAAARAAPRAARRRRPRLPRRRLGGALAAAAARGRAGRGHPEHALRAPARAGRVRPARPLAAEGVAAAGRQRDPGERADGRDPPAGPRALRHRRHDRRPDRRAAGDALRAAARPGHEGVEGGGAEGRPELRPRDDGDPDPGADPRQAGGGGRGAGRLAADRHARRHLRRPAGHREPARGLARQGHLRNAGLGRSRPHAAHPHRRHHRLGQVGLHQHDPDLDPAPLDPGRRAADPDRPEADRARTTTSPSRIC